MKIPRYWVKEAVQVAGPGAEPRSIACWGWSDSGIEEARAVARERVARVAARMDAGGDRQVYLYGDNPLREEVLREVAGADGQPEAIITRNGYGCQVLNAARVMFVDVDLPAPGLLERWMRAFARLRSRGSAPDHDRCQAAAVAKLETLLARDARAGARVYRTAGGLRYLFTAGLADPIAAGTGQLMAMLGADPLYMRLCRVQECFRARLTPKPWRCGVHAPGVSYPWANAAAEARFRQWERGYATAATGFATCRFLRAIGSPDTHPEVRPIIELHDAACRAESDLPLA